VDAVEQGPPLVPGRSFRRALFAAPQSLKGTRIEAAYLAAILVTLEEAEAMAPGFTAD